MKTPRRTFAFPDKASQHVSISACQLFAFADGLPSQLAQFDLDHAVVRALVQDEVGAFAGWGDVLPQVDAVYVVPDPARHRLGLLRGEVGVAVEVGGLVLEHRARSFRNRFKNQRSMSASSAST